MPLPALSNWGQTRVGLHQAAQVVGAIRKFQAEPLPNYMHLPLYVIPQGVTSGDLAVGGELVLNFPNRAIEYTCPKGQPYAVPLAGHTQMSLLDAVLQKMEAAGHPAQPSRDKLHSEGTLEVDAGLAADYAQAQHRLYSAIARFRARLFGNMSRLIVWPHGFDLSMLWFARGSEETQDPHLNFGFSPGSPGFERPYVYAYAHPKPPGMLAVKLPDMARWNTTPWTGVVIDYDDLAADSDAESTLERLLWEIHTALSPLLG